MHIRYDEYIDRILGGWIGKSLGGTIGARFEGKKEWIEHPPAELFPATIPPNDDLDLQVLWLKVLEEKGPALTSDDLAQAWLDGCWYPWNEYGIFRRNWRLGIRPPHSGRFGNAFWDTGMGCPIRSEIWGYVFPGAPELAAEYAERDGVLDHTEQSVGAERMFAAMASMAFWVSDLRRLTSMFQHHLPPGTPIERLTRAAFECHAMGLSLREARDRLLALAGHPEACDAQINVPIVFLAILYGQNDLEETLLAALRCGYDTDCTMATAGAFLGQILGASRIPERLRAPLGDTLVCGMEYRRPEMTLSALARDTARVGVRLAEACRTGVHIGGAPASGPAWPCGAAAPHLTVGYQGLPAAAPGQSVAVTVTAEGPLAGPTRLTCAGPAGWEISPADVTLGPSRRCAVIGLHLRADTPQIPQRNLFTLRLEHGADCTHTFGVAGADLWQLLGVYYDSTPQGPMSPLLEQRRWQHHFVSLDRPYLPEPEPPADDLFRRWSRVLGRPALLAAPEQRVDVTDLVGLRGAYVVYLARTVVSPEDRDAHLVVGNNDAYRIWLNGERIGEADECVWWTPFNAGWPVRLKAGANRLLVKLVKRGERLDFSLGLRHRTRPDGRFNDEDWMTDLADRNPLLLL